MAEMAQWNALMESEQWRPIVDPQAVQTRQKAKAESGWLDTKMDVTRGLDNQGNTAGLEGLGGCRRSADRGRASGSVEDGGAAGIEYIGPK